VPRDILLTSISLFLWGFGEGLFINFQTIYLKQQWGATPVLIGTILGIVGLVTVVCQIPAGYLSDRIGARPVMWAAWFTASITLIIMAFTSSLVVFIVAMAFYWCTSFVMPPLNRYMANMRGKMKLERAMTIGSVFYNSGAVVGPILGGLMGDAYGLQTVFRVSPIIIFLSTFTILWIRAEPKIHHSTDRHPIHLIRNSRFFVLLGIMSFTLFALFLPQPMTTYFLQTERNISLTQIGQLSAIGSLGNVFAMFFLGNFNALVAVFIGQAFIGIFSLVFWLGNGMAWFGVGYLFISGYRLSRNMMNAFIRPLVKEAETGLAFGFLETVGSITQVIAPPVAGFLYTRDPLSIYSTSFFLIIIFLVVNLFLLPRFQSRKEPTIEPITYT